VKADNGKPAIGSTTEHVLPLAGDFFQHGGMYRGVSLIEANDVGIDLLDFGGPGVYVSTLSAKPIALEVKGQHDDSIDEVKYYSGYRSKMLVRAKVRNASSSKAKIRANVRFFCDQYKDVSATAPLGWWSKSVTVDRAGTAEIPITFDYSVIRYATFCRPWAGTAEPSLISARIDLFEGKALVDSVVQSFGIRDFKFDPNSGFSLNGKPLKLKGVSRHQDKLGKGYALTREDHAEDMKIIKEMGANSVRHAHYQHADEWSDEADKAGMIVWAEVPFVTTPSFTGGEGSAEVFANAEQQTRELIRQNYNHPSIMMWSVGNEVDAAALFGISKEPVQPRKLLDHIAKIAREEDPSRPTVFADCCEDVRSPVAGLEGQAQGEQLAGAADMIGYNRYYGWYYPQPLKAAEQLAAQMDKFHVKHPTLPISISEYGAGGAIGQHSDNVLTGFVNAVGRPQPEEYESWVHEQSWPVIRDRKYIWGSYVWNMFDFASDLRNEGDAVDINTKGLVTFDRKTRKDAFYYYKAQWTTEPMIHLTGKRHMDRAYQVMEVRAYTNLPMAFLSVNRGTSIETACPGGICVWKDVALKSGPNQVTVTTGTNDRGMPVQIEDNATFNGPDPVKDGIHLDAGDIAGRLIGTRRFGSDTFVTGGTLVVLNQGGFGGRGAPKKAVTAPDPALYDYWREGEAFSYAIPLPDGKWTVTIHSFEPRATGTEAATMSVLAGGKLAFAPFNIAKAAGGALKGVAKSFPVMVQGGVLKLDFAGQGGKAVIAAIEITKEGSR
jgi:beta-galactosidase